MSVLHTKLKEEEEFSFHRHFAFLSLFPVYQRRIQDNQKVRLGSHALVFLTMLPGLQELQAPTRVEPGALGGESTES